MADALEAERFYDWRKRCERAEKLIEALDALVGIEFADDQESPRREAEAARAAWQEAREGKWIVPQADAEKVAKNLAEAFGPELDGVFLSGNLNDKTPPEVLADYLVEFAETLVPLMKGEDP